MAKTTKTPLRKKSGWQSKRDYVSLSHIGEDVEVIYESRESGLLSDVWLQADPHIQNQIAEKWQIKF